jgi:Ca2+-transporting ATPase
MKGEVLKQPFSHAAEDVLAGMDSRKTGLSVAEAKQRLAQYGENQLPQARAANFLEVVWHQFASPLIYILVGAAVLALLLQEYMDALFIAVVLLLNAGIGTWQEWRAAQMAATLRTLLKPYVTVRRDGKSQTIAAVELVPGDIVLLESGVKVPADLRLISADELQVDEAILTGESLPVQNHRGHAQRHAACRPCQHGQSWFDCGVGAWYGRSDNHRQGHRNRQTE